MPPMADVANGFRRVVQLGNAQQQTSWTLTVGPGIHYWSVQAVDGAYAGSGFAVEESLGFEEGGVIEEIVDVPNDQGRQVSLSWIRSWYDYLGSPIPTINSAVEGRIISAYKDERVPASKILTGPKASFSGDPDKLIDAVRQALYASKICSYAQGMALLRAASRDYEYNLDLKECSRIWRGGCIIRASFLDLITEAFKRNPDLPNLLLDDFFRGEVESRLDAWRYVVKTAVENGVPTLGFSASLAYYDAYRSERLPANLIQAQRDYFGAHTYERLDKPGSFHTEWMEE